MKILIILIALLALFAALVCYSACVVAGRTDEWEEQKTYNKGYREGFGECIEMFKGTIDIPDYDYGQGVEKEKDQCVVMTSAPAEKG